MINILTVLTWFTSKKAYLANYADNVYYPRKS